MSFAQTNQHISQILNFLSLKSIQIRLDLTRSQIQIFRRQFDCFFQLYQEKIKERGIKEKERVGEKK